MTFTSRKAMNVTNDDNLHIISDKEWATAVADNEAGATFDNSFFDNCFGFLRQCKNRSFLGSVFVHATGRRQN